MSSVPGAASTVVRDLLDAPAAEPRAAVVRHVGATRVGLQVGPRLLVLERSPGAGTLPCAVVVPGLRPASVGAPGDVVRLDVDGVHGAAQQVLVTRWWAPSRVVPAPTSEAMWTSPGPMRGSDPFTSGPGGGPLDGEVVAALDAAAEALLEGRTDDAAGALVAVLGRGAGSTPDADDAVAGLLLAARRELPRSGHQLAHLDHLDHLDQVGRRVAAAAPGRTTALSAELLRLAAEGVAAPAVVQAVCRPSPSSRAALLALGATSGAATAAGIDLLHRHLARRAARATNGWAA